MRLKTRSKKYISSILMLLLTVGILFSTFNSEVLARGSSKTSKTYKSSTKSRKSSPTSGYKSGSVSKVKPSTSTSKSYSTSTSKSGSVSRVKPSTSTSTSKASTGISTSKSNNTGNSSYKSYNDSKVTPKANTTTNKNYSKSHSNYNDDNYRDHDDENYRDSHSNKSNRSRGTTSSSRYKNSNRGSTYISGTTVITVLILIVIVVLIILVVKKIKNNSRGVSSSEDRNTNLGDLNIDEELEACNKLYSDCMFNLDNIGDFVPKDVLEDRRYIKYLPILKEYITLLDKGVQNKKDKELLSNIVEYKNKHAKELIQIKDCVKCACFKCVKECKMEGCNRCELGCHIASCDNNTTAVYLYSNKTLELKNDKTGEIGTHKVLSVVQDLEYTTLYIITELDGEKYVYYFYPGISEDTYGEIEDVDDFNFAIRAYEQSLGE